MESNNEPNKKFPGPLAHKLLVAAGIISAIGVVGLVLVNQFLYAYRDPWNKKVADAGFTEKKAQIGDVTLNYAEGPNNGPALLLLHAQHMEWFSYSRVLPELSKSFHIFAVDYHGHGKTVSPVERYNASDMGNDLATFIETVIGEPAFVTGNSSGGLLTAWLAANKPDLVRAIVLEDPPLFTAEYPRIKDTISYVSFTSCHEYIEAGEDSDFLIYWLNSHAAFVAKNVGDYALPILLSVIQTYHEKNPGEPLEIRFLSDYLRTFMRGIDRYDPYFGNAFYDGSWNEGFDHAETLQRITQPTLLLHANYEIREDGVLNGALSQEDADLVVSLIPNAQYLRVDSAHAIHLDKPDQFIQAIEAFFLGEANVPSTSLE
ncbi:alpha/beta hydrolase [Phototrophicus methaneseepsis]|uniref:Alpha/beta hydrolase n=1 Tax=Phototrophicus methaneseepsis TaxID=2710758 RepID=A0A7S8E5Q5_9CHLR|nr:alpha/beta hydrolase [Phototrophicus methaneseepsis]QPC80830.1 alpha/beta hydrolase [Phototrophicus methaneseepsis]